MPVRPDEATFRAADSTQKCKLTAPRAMRCSSELMIADLRATSDRDDGGLVDAIEDDLAKHPKPLSDNDPRAMHENQCRGSLDDGYTKGVFECWTVADCKKFAECVMKTPNLVTH